MSDDWKVGDLALCISKSPLCPDCYVDPRDTTCVGATYKVAIVKDYRETFPGLDFADYPHPDGGHWCACTFRKIRPDEHEDCEPEFVELLNRSKPKVPAPLSEEGVSQ